VTLSKLQEMITFFLVAGSPGAIREIFSGLEVRCRHDGLHVMDPRNFVSSDGSGAWQCHDAR
jgi:hypothetical protein